MAESQANNTEELNIVDEDKTSEIIVDDGSGIMEEQLNIEVGQDEMDDAGSKRKKSGILGRLSNRKKKKRLNTTDEHFDDGKTGSNVELNDEKASEQDEIKTDDNIDTVAGDKLDEKAVDAEEVVEEKASGEDVDEGLYDMISNIITDTVENVEEVVDNASKKKSGLLRKLSVKKKKKKPADDSKNDATVQVNESAVETEEKMGEGNKIDQNSEEKQEEPKDDEAKKEDGDGETQIKKKKPGRLRRLSFSKPKKAKKQRENAEETGNEEAEKNLDKNIEDSDSIKVQNVQEKCDVPETSDQSQDELNQPITVDKENEDGSENGGNKSYLYAVVELPIDMAQKALVTIKNAFKPVLIYIIRKNPHCFKDIIEKNNKKNACCPTEM